MTLAHKQISDFTKAFYTIPHWRLSHKLQWYGIRGRVHSWISSFLNGQSQCVILDGISSFRYPILSGVPQGTVLGPTPSNLYK